MVAATTVAYIVFQKRAVGRSCPHTIRAALETSSIQYGSEGNSFGISIGGETNRSPIAILYIEDK